MSLAIISIGTKLENVSTMSRATFVVLLCSLLALFNFLCSVCHDYGFESMGQGFDEALYLGLLGDRS